MKKLIDNDISKLITSFNIPFVYVDASKHISWDQYMEIYGTMKTCMEQKRPVCVVEGNFSDPTKIDDLTIFVSVPTKVDTTIDSRGSAQYSFYFGSGVMIYKEDSKYILDDFSEYAYGWFADDINMGIKGTGCVQEWL